MAINDKKGHVHGKIGPLVYRTSGGQQIVQSQPRKFKQTLATKLTGHEFGLASCTAGLIRRVIQKIIDHADKRMSYRFTGLIRNCLHHIEKPIGERNLHDADLTALRGFQFNLEAPFERVLKKVPVSTVDEQGNIHFELVIANAAKDFAFIQWQNAVNATVKLTSLAFDFSANFVQTLDHQEFEIPEKKPYTIRYTSRKNLPPGAIVIVLLSLHYHTIGWLADKKPINDPKYNAAGILHAFHATEEMARKGDEDLFSPIGTPLDLNDEIRQILKRMQGVIKKEKEDQSKKQKNKAANPRLIYVKKKP